MSAMMNKTVITVNDKMQKNYAYERIEPEGKHFSPEFNPQLSPQEMLELGVFGGVYLRDCTEEFPDNWFTNAKLSTGKRDTSLNYFNVHASLSLLEWRNKGWIYADDPRGWFQWYCRYYSGRRIYTEDLRQIKRWKAMKRHAGAVKKFCEPYDFSCRKKQRQALLHWAYDSRSI
jgi:hypothetical protein